MSGSSLDGVDIAFCKFGIDASGEIIYWKITEAETIPFTAEWKKRLYDLPTSDASYFIKTHVEFGHLLGRMISDFMARHTARADYIASHGHTIFHNPSERYTSQIGDGAAIAAITGIPAIVDFRGGDVALGGQGAPFAPFADKHLFKGYDFYLNLGGIANVSFVHEDTWTAFDIAPANQVLNHLASQLGFEYDIDGGLARSGVIVPELYKRLQDFDFYSARPPKSMDNNWIRERIFPLYDNFETSVENKIRTAVSHLVENIFREIKILTSAYPAHVGGWNMLSTGGGTLNKFLMEEIYFRMLDIKGFEVHKPDEAVIQYKEALLMALLGVMRIEGKSNTLKNVTGAISDSIGGALYLPPIVHH